MAKKQFILTIDTETTISDKVVDFGAIVTDKKGIIQTQCAVLIGAFYIDPENHQLFYDYTSDVNSIWNKASIERRRANYDTMLQTGTRMLCSVNGINRWLEKVAATFNPHLTAYNLPFDVDKCQKTGIDLTLFPKRFCLWGAASQRWGHTKKYLQFALEQHAFNNRTALGNMSIKANAEIMARFVLNEPDLIDEPHTALEDIIGYELPILKAIVKGKKLSSLESLKPRSWQQNQLKDHFSAK